VAPSEKSNSNYNKYEVMENLANQVSEQIRKQLMFPMSNKARSPVRIKMWNQVRDFMCIEIREGLVSQVIRNTKL
jgi:hypothetical protein